LVLVVVLGALLLCGAVAAHAATTPSLTSPSQTLSSTPPVSLGPSPKPGPKRSVPKSTGAAPASSLHSLPYTGFDVLELVLIGVALLVAGIGLRLRTRDIRWPRRT
jgi:hypothetical protein